MGLTQFTCRFTYESQQSLISNGTVAVSVAINPIFVASLPQVNRQRVDWRDSKDPESAFTHEFFSFCTEIQEVSRGPAIKTNSIVIILQRLQYSAIRNAAIQDCKCTPNVLLYKLLQCRFGPRGPALSHGIKYIMDAVPGLSRLLVCGIYSKSQMFVGGCRK